MKSYYRLMLGRASVHAAECFAGNFVGVHFGIDQDLSHELPDAWQDSNKKFIPVYLQNRPEKTKVAAGLACGAIWTVAKGMKLGDILLCPDGQGRYRVGEIVGGYEYAEGLVLPHRRPVAWSTAFVDRQAMSDALRASTGAIGTISNITPHQAEIETLIAGGAGPVIVSTDDTIEDPATFALEKHLEDFLVQNWAHTLLGKHYDIFKDEDGLVGQQYQTDTGPIDILAVSKDKKELLVLELKRGRASDVVIGQILRYMGYVQEVLTEPGQKVKGVVIALDDDQRLRRAISMVPSVEFYRYQVHFDLVKV